MFLIRRVAQTSRMQVVKLTYDFCNVHKLSKHNTFGDSPAHVNEQYSSSAVYNVKRSMCKIYLFNRCKPGLSEETRITRENKRHGNPRKCFWERANCRSKRLRYDQPR